MALDNSKSTGSLPFLRACEKGETKPIIELLAQEINVDLQNEQAECGLFKAAECGHEDVVKVLLEHKANVNTRNGDKGKSALMAASKNGHSKTVQKLIEYEADINMQDNEGWSALLMACFFGFYEVVKELLEHQVDVNLQANNGWSALMFAVLNERIDIAQLLIEHGAHVNMQNNVGSTSLMIATKNGYKEIATLLIEYEADVNIQMKGGWSALMFAGESGHTEIARLLLKHKADVDMQMSEGLTPLILASQNGHTNIIELLLEYEADINKVTFSGLSALMIASQTGNVQTVKLLLEHHTNVNAQMKDSGLSALMIASQLGHTKVMKVLLENGAYVNLLTENGLTALMLGCLNDSADAVAILLEHQADVNLQMNDGLSALMIASQNGNVDNARLLLEHGAKADMSDSDGWTALIYSSQHGYTEIVEILLHHTVNVNKQDNNGWSALMIAGQNGHYETAAVLLDSGADESLQTVDKLSALMIASKGGYVNNVHLLLGLEHMQGVSDIDKTDIDGRSSLMIASQYGYTEIVKLLLEYHATVNKQDKNGWSALMIASQFGHYNTANTLLEHGADENLKTCENLSALMIGSLFGDVEIVQLLLEHSADANLQDEDGASALIMASKKGYSNIVKLLVHYKVDVNKADRNGWTALMHASKLGSRESVIALLEAGANADLKADNGWTARMIADLNEHREIAKLLREHKTMKVGSRLSYSSGGIIQSPGSSSRLLPATRTPTSGQNNYSPMMGRATLPYRSTRGLKFTLGISSSGYGSGSGHGSGSGPEDTRSASELSSGSVSSNEGSRSVNKSAESVLFWKLGAWKCAETAVLVTNSEKDQYFSWNKFGLNLHIASKSLPPEFLSCTIHITATTVGDYQFPPNTHPVSAVYWLQCIPACKFVKPVTLEIQHCGKNLSELYFVKASSVQSLIQEQYYGFQKTKGCSNSNHGIFPPKSLYGFIQLESFSGYGVVQDDSEERSYCASLYYFGQVETQWHIHLAVSWNTDTHRSAINEQYHKRGFESETDQEIEFESDRITLDIPLNGLVTMNKGWKIVPLNPPLIMKREVDSYEVGKRIPACQLYATAIPSTVLMELHHILNMNGAKDPFNVFTVYRAYDNCGVHFNASMVQPPPPIIEPIGPKPSIESQLISTDLDSKARGRKSSISRRQFFRLKKSQLLKRKKRTRKPISSATAASLIDPSLDTQMENEMPSCSLISVGTIATQESQPTEDLLRLRYHDQSIREVIITETTSTSSKPPEFVILLRELSDVVSARWEDIGIQLHLSPGILEIIKKDNPGDCRVCLREMLKEWMKQVEPPPSWPAIITAIKSCGYRQLAFKLKRIYLPTPTVEMLI